jgi:hypothetical protein
MTFKIIMVVNTKITVFWDVTTIVVHRYQSIRRTCCLFIFKTGKTDTFKMLLHTYQNVRCQTVI